MRVNGRNAPQSLAPQSEDPWLILGGSCQPEGKCKVHQQGAGDKSEQSARKAGNGMGDAKTGQNTKSWNQPGWWETGTRRRPERA